MNKEFHGSTKPECDFIDKLLSDAYASGMVYDVSDMRSAVLTFAAASTHQALYCIDLVNKMKWASENNIERDRFTRPRSGTYEFPECLAYR